MEKSFSGLKKAFSEVSGQKHLKIDQKTMTYPGLQLHIDFSRFAIAAVLHQTTSQGERFISAKTRTLKPYKRRYCSAKGELLALLHGLSKFKHILSCQKFVVISDNLSVKNVKTAKLGSNSVLAHWLDTLSKFDFNIIYRPGKELIAVDTLSRLT